VNLIVTCAPFRVSFAGGGTDLPAFFNAEPGAVLSTTINKYVYVIINRRSSMFRRGVSLSCSPVDSGPFDPNDPIQFPIRISYSATENVHSVNELQHPIVREALRMLDISDPMDISTLADVPAGTGLGSSSTFAVALLHALHVFKGETVNPATLAAEAAHLEIDVLRRPVGKQDHYAAAVGGMNLLGFLPSQDVTVERLSIDRTVIDSLFEHVLLFYTGIHRNASEVLTEQSKNTNARRDDLAIMRDHAYMLQRQLGRGFDLSAFGAILHATWVRKSSLAQGISTGQIDQWYARARAAGAVGGKVCGAGGGGFLLLLAPRERHPAIREALAELAEMEIAYEPRGCRVLTVGELVLAGAGSV
jgi:D-glycero-alpha-D-manno-heptose-7-phosphate kinase